MKRDQLKSFVFRGILARHVINDLQAGGLLHRPSVSTVERTEINLFAPVQEKIRNGSLEMQKAYRLLFVFENIIRELITDRFEEPDGPDWFTKRASLQMKSKVSQRREQEDRNHWHSGRSKEDIYYLDFGDLAKLITTHWTLFQDLLPSQAWVQSRLDEAERSRNVIAHTNILASEEVSRLEMYVRDWIRQTG